jgi:nitroreductase
VRRKLDLDRPVQTAVLMECVQVAVQAPTPRSPEQWRWLIVADQAVRRELGAVFRQVGNAYLQARLADGASARALASAQYLVDVIERVPVFVIPCVLGRPGGDNAALSVFYGGIYPAVWNFQLALRSRGLGSTLTTYHLEREAEAARILGIPDDVTQICLLPIGYTTASDFNPAPRTPAAEICYLNTWRTPAT